MIRRLRLRRINKRFGGLVVVGLLIVVTVFCCNYTTTTSTSIITEVRRTSKLKSVTEAKTISKAKILTNIKTISKPKTKIITNTKTISKPKTITEEKIISNPLTTSKIKIIPTSSKKTSIAKTTSKPKTASKPKTTLTTSTTTSSQSPLNKNYAADFWTKVNGTEEDGGRGGDFDGGREGDKDRGMRRQEGGDVGERGRRSRVRSGNVRRLRDWHDYETMAREAKRRGPGELGEAAVLRENDDDNVDDFDGRQERSIREVGFNAVLSDAISVERSLPDVRHEGCRHRKYLARLPPASVIIIFHNEHLSVLLRTLHSLLNRTPPELLHEIILVDDFSDPKYTNLEDYFQRHLVTKTRVHLLRMRERIGLIRARIEGARNATGDVLVFLDAHVEATHNWLPPLLQPIVRDWRTSTTPLIDRIDYRSFAYEAQQGHGSRGHFNWQFNFVQLPLLAEDIRRLPQPHPNPVMSGGLFAIAAKWFWHLGAYDPHLQIWGAEEFELSFKIWMCGGRILEVPCSRMGHLYRDPEFHIKHNTTDDFIARNYKRVAEVWMDEYRYFLYERSPKLTQIDAGDLSERHALRRSLHCHTFKWFIDEIAWDLMNVYPPVEPPDFASGALKSLAEPELCLDAESDETRRQLDRLRPCSPDLTHPYVHQQWSLTFRHELRVHEACLEVQTAKSDAPPHLWPCHLQGENQFWYYDRQSQMLIHGPPTGESDGSRRCLEADLTAQRVRVNPCDMTKSTMRWSFGYVNNTAMDDRRFY